MAPNRSSASVQLLYYGLQRLPIEDFDIGVLFCIPR